MKPCVLDKIKGKHHEQLWSNQAPPHTQQFPWAVSEFPVSSHPLSRDIRQRQWYNPSLGHDVAKIIWCLSFHFFFFLEPSKGKVRNVILLCGSLLWARVPWFHLRTWVWGFCALITLYCLWGFLDLDHHRKQTLWGWIWWGWTEPHVAWPHFLLKILRAKERYVIPDLDSGSWHSSVRQQMSFPEAAVRRGTPSDTC